MEFHISREVRDRYQFGDALFSFSGNVVFANLAASREFAQQMNLRRAEENLPPVHAAALYAMGLIDEMSHALFAYYRKRLDPRVMADALERLAALDDPHDADRTLRAFTRSFPAVDVYRGKKNEEEWLRESTDGVRHSEAALEEMIMLWLANANPAFAPFRELFSDHDLAASTAYRKIMRELPAFFEGRPRVGSGRLSLIEMLRAPAAAAPGSLSGQIAFIREKWAPIIGADLDRLLLAIDVLKEEELAIWMRFHSRSAGRGQQDRPQWNQGKAETFIPSYTDAAQEQERFSPDQEWMPSTVLLAKSTYVWLEQLSRQYRREVRRLDQIPNEELARIAHRGINALWLIGVWERSPASETIKKLCGNEDAVASAYSLFDYSVAADLGGEGAYRDLRDRAMTHGIRLASDMVPNHMGIDSKWVIEHPEWFLSRDDSPYPSYRFEGPDLSRDGRVEVKIEDHYYERSDAAVVFRRRDKWTNDIRYIYHGNDGTSFPWNDTAQLNYLNPATREQVIQTILHVARLFPIIRFDAAMTLAKRHFQRLWFPVPGTGGAIPSRAECSMSKAQFDAAMPEEFWREVVDRVAREVPGTLLLAEAFWLMEGYFVRTLGMHRVYNSAFMNMLRDEENAKYRNVIKSTIEFDPDILKRYVNFMSNPDEKTAIEQFGNGDKCFGVTAVMATLPGLPMFGHGQIEGFHEKYGMEYRRPRYEEHPDQWLVERHEREIALLLKRRWLFAESENFLLYDFYRDDGSVDENVFAYSNRRDSHRALVVYHNRFATTRGTIHQSAAYADKKSGHQERRSLATGLNLPGDGGRVMAFRDQSSGLEHLIRAGKLAAEGLSLELEAYEYHVFVDWRELTPDAEHPWDRLADSLGGRGVPNLDDALLQMELEPLHRSLTAVLLASAQIGEPATAAPAKKRESVQLPPEFEERSATFFKDAERVCSKLIPGWNAKPSLEGQAEIWRKDFAAGARNAMELPLLAERDSGPWSTQAKSVVPHRGAPSSTGPMLWGPILGRLLLSAMAVTGSPVEIFETLRLRAPMADAFTQLGLQGEDSWRAAAMVRLAVLAEFSQPKPNADEPEREVQPDRRQQKGRRTSAAPPVAPEPPHQASPSQGTKAPLAEIPPQLWNDADARWLLGVNESAAALYFNRELYERVLWWLALPQLAEAAALPAGARSKAFAAITEAIHGALENAQKSGYRLDLFLGTAETADATGGSSGFAPVAKAEASPETAR